MNCTKCDNVFKCNGEIHDNCHINDEGLVCPDCVENEKCDCEHCEEEDDEECWTCGKPDPTHKEYRDALGKNEYTCDECHRNEYPEQYEEEVHCCGTCGCDLDEEYWKSFAFEQSTTEPNEVYCSSKCEPYEPSDEELDKLLDESEMKGQKEPSDEELLKMMWGWEMKGRKEKLELLSGMRTINEAAMIKYELNQLTFEEWSKEFVSNH